MILMKQYKCVVSLVIIMITVSMSMIMICRYNRFECQVSPDIHNKHQMIRAAATLDVQG